MRSRLGKFSQPGSVPDELSGRFRCLSLQLYDDMLEQMGKLGSHNLIAKPIAAIVHAHMVGQIRKRAQNTGGDILGYMERIDGDDDL